MSDNRTARAKKNIVVSLGCQITTLFCGFIVPRLLIGAFGSETYGITTSITQFLAYITLLEGGIGGVARAALYDPLARNDREAIGDVVSEIHRFFRVIAYVFVAYALILACSFHRISRVTCMDWMTTFLLVIVISVSSFGQYYIGISNTVLLQAAQKSYITNAVSIAATVVNTILVVVLVYAGCGIITVKLVSSCIFFLRPVAQWLYVRYNFQIRHTSAARKKVLSQKWEGLGQHIAFFLHSNTDVVVLTCLADLSSVAVYSVYNMVVSHIQNLAVSCVSGMEAMFGDMLAKKEYDQLHKTFGYYETLISVVAMILFSVTAVMLLPFVRIYTAGITDADYIAPVFSILLVLSGVLYCLRMPYHSLVIAAGHFRQTRTAAYAEVVINVVFSVLLVRKYHLIGVAAATVAATAFRFGYYVFYLSRNIFQRRLRLFAKRAAINMILFGVMTAAGCTLVSLAPITGYVEWAFYAAVTAVLAAALTLGVNMIFYRTEFSAVLQKFYRK